MQLLFSHPQFQRDRQLHQTCTLSDRCDRDVSLKENRPIQPMATAY
jgi:hypothetical protein